MTRVRLSVLGSMAGVFLAVAASASAATFSLNPTQIFLSSRASSALLTLRNDSDETLRFQLSAFGWQQGTSGEIQLTATQDVVFFPALLTLKPKEERRIRIGATVTSGAQEKTYRIFVEELPAADAGQQNAAVRVLTKMGVPIFIRPTKETATAALADLGLRDGALRFTLSNTGTIHIVPQRVRVRAMGADGQPVFEREVPGWYVLAGGRREFELSIRQPDCERISSLVVEAGFDATSLKETLQTPAGACGR